MRNIQIPTFDEKRNFIGFKIIKIKNKPTHKDVMKITAILPGFCCGYCPDAEKLGVTVDKIEIRRFYDSRQGGLNKLKNFYVSVI